MVIQRTGIAFSADDLKRIAEIQAVLEKERGEKVSMASAVRYALNQTAAMLKKR